MTGTTLTTAILSASLFAACAAPTATDADYSTDRPVLHDTGDGDSGEIVAPPLPFAPADGQWTIQAKDITNDPCAVATQLERGQPGSTYSLTNDEAPRFKIQYGTDEASGTGGEMQSCVTDEDETGFTCEAIAYGEDLRQEHNLKAEILINLSAHGHFSDENEMQLVNDVVLDCTGDDCWLVEIGFKAEFPCELSTSVSALANAPVETQE
jgi:hypothetical protein